MLKQAHERRSRPMRPAISGVLLVDKPLDWTSHDVIAKLRGATGIKRIGHAGTLDPAATGVLVVMLGPATRLSQYLLKQDKTYIATFKFGTTTDTDDAEGSVIGTSDVDPKLFTKEFAEKTVAALIGNHAQVPPQYSSIKSEGVVAHKAARSGGELSLEPRDIEILDAHLVGMDEENLTWTLELKVSKGTYIRSIARDLGAELGCGAHISELCRTASGSMHLEDAHPLDMILETAEKDAGVSTLIIDTLKLFPGIRIHSTDTPIIQGKFLPATALTAAATSRAVAAPVEKTQLIPIVSYDERLLALYLNDGDELKPDTVFPGGVFPPHISDCVATIGTFDGVHTGHTQLLDRTVADARKKKVPSVAITFDPLPQSQLDQPDTAGQLLTLKDRVAYIKERGIDHVVIIPFTPETAALTPERFIHEKLYARCTPQTLYVGENFRFGTKALAGPDELRAIMSSTQTEVISVNLHTFNGNVVSSTRIRRAIANKNFKIAKELLGRRVAFSGTVVQGVGLGTGLGYPTANLVNIEPLHLPIGIYSGYVRIEMTSGSPAILLHKAAIFIGRPRETDNDVTVEIHLLDTTRNLYGAKLCVEVEEYICPTSRYYSIEELKDGIAVAIKKVRHSLENTNVGAHH